MSEVRSHALFGPELLAAGAPALVYTAPAGRTVLVKSLRIVNTTGAAGVELALELDRGGGGVSIWPAGQPIVGLVWDTSWFVMEAGDTLLAAASSADVLSLLGSGAVLLA